MTHAPFRIATVISALLSLAACASVPPASDRLTQQSRAFIPPPGKANVYVVRPYNYAGSCCVWPVSLDFQEFGSLGLSSYLYGVVDPGDHFVGSTLMGSSPTRVKFNATAGSNYFFKISPGFASISIDRLTEEDGRQRVLEYTASGDNRFEFVGATSAPH